VPIRLTNEVLHELVEARVLSETRANGSKDLAYQPAQAVDRLTIASVLEALDDRGTDALPLVESPELDRLTAGLGQFREALRSSPANVALRDL
jgi:membrane protein